MTPLEFIYVVSKISYKYDWEIDVARSVYTSDLTIRISFLNRDSTKPDSTRPTTILLTECISAKLIFRISQEEAIDYIRRLIARAEDHEFKEWFKFEGKCVIEPHPERVKNKEVERIRGMELAGAVYDEWPMNPLLGGEKSFREYCDSVRSKLRGIFSSVGTGSPPLPRAQATLAPYPQIRAPANLED